MQVSSNKKEQRWKPTHETSYNIKINMTQLFLLHYKIPNIGENSVPY